MIVYHKRITVKANLYKVIPKMILRINHNLVIVKYKIPNLDHNQTLKEVKINSN